MVLGVDGMDPKLTKKFVDEGLMPNVKKYMELGVCRDDLQMLGSQPTVTPAQWTTLAVGANPNVHGICQFSRQVPGAINVTGYNLDSRLCKAEPVWNCFAEAGKKTAVFHWPGSAWPPTSDSDNLYVIDGTCPGVVGMAAMGREGDLFINASEKFTETTFIPKGNAGGTQPCVIEELPEGILQSARGAGMSDASNAQRKVTGEVVEKMKYSDATMTNIIMNPYDGWGIGTGRSNQVLDVARSTIKPAKGWVDAPEGAKEMTILFSGGFMRRPCLILKNEDGIYDTLAIYRSKKSSEPLGVIKCGEMLYDYIDDVLKNDVVYKTNRNIRVMSMAEDGSEVSIFASSAMDLNCDEVIHPQRLHQALLENAGPFPPQCQLYTQSEEVATNCMIPCWEHEAHWYEKAFDYLIEKEGVEVIFSHFHAIDMVEHTFIRMLGGEKGWNEHPHEVYQRWMELLYEQTDRYLGYFLKYLDEGWTIFITSDHAQVCGKYRPLPIGDMQGTSIGVMRDLGYTVMKKDENGNDIKQIDWSKTRAINSQANDIFINLKGREPFGIVDPADKYELEEQIITDLYSLRHPVSGKRVIALALHNKDAVLLGYGGPTAGDVCFWIAEGYNYDHTDSLSTTCGEWDTSSSPIFIGVGPGLKKSYRTDRIIRQVDFAPTIAYLGGVRMPDQAEGAIVYQILDEEF